VLLRPERPLLPARGPESGAADARFGSARRATVFDTHTRTNGYQYSNRYRQSNIDGYYHSHIAKPNGHDSISDIRI
jgi:hypothetical protein